MSKLTELLDELCPDGVEYRRLGEVANLQRGTSITKKNVVHGDIPVVAGGRVPAYFHNVSNRDGETIVVAGSGAYAGFVSWWDCPIFVSDAFSVKVKDSSLSNRYCYYWMTSMQELLHQSQSGGGVPHVYAKDVAKLRIPVPPLGVQQEIVRVLDAFTSLEQSLASELELRKKQFDSYVESTMKPDRMDPRVLLGNVATIVRGASPRPIKRFVVEGGKGIPWIKIGDVRGDAKYVTETAQRITEEGAKKSRRIEPGDFILSNSMSFGRPYISQIHGCIHDGWLAISDFEETYRSDYLYYLLRSQAVQVEFDRRAGAGTVKNLNADIVKSVEVAAPVLSRQDQVVVKLNALSTLIQSIEQEIALRRKQYEYYRDELLSFTPSTSKGA